MAAPSPCGQDRPRSRGVYDVAIGHPISAEGSSPLARGLHIGQPMLTREPRIIPARAGFTARTAPSPAPRGDHPRSRGVYILRRVTLGPVWGSSPLARGLRSRIRARRRGTQDHPRSRGVYESAAQDRVLRGRIIPARAGFTQLLTGAHLLVLDHPRSRGVYFGASGVPFCAMGSSPLARGLHYAGRLLRWARRIIPARAGFTQALSQHGTVATDHPRSRGVYMKFLPPFAKNPGSSPLARGLPGLGCETPRQLRIIPARAGFTRLGRGRCRGSRDHPRSRGVYSFQVPDAVEDRGSSPLARGLRWHGLARGGGGRIIPARAGFTRPTPASGTSSADHPRSRGVYGTQHHIQYWQIGSSPLARGLRLQHRRRRGRGGIIPARAGFTLSMASKSWRRWDHPRSRGVYVYSIDADGGEGGSSPLARGLPGP